MLIAKGWRRPPHNPFTPSAFHAAGKNFIAPSGPYIAQLAKDRAAARRSLLDDVIGAEEAETLTAAATGLEPLAPGCTIGSKQKPHYRCAHAPPACIKETLKEEVEH